MSTLALTERAPFWDEVRSDPWLLAALGTGSLLTAAFFIAHACCFGAEAAMLKSLSVICSSAV
ncbi:hypothetical protein [Roseibium sp.]|uniref:hypothetical protein n=1 Tax=Roseibium sp. TaxID=1936156 RepID=UPI003A975D06